jgi:PIN domain nuclease of toxin-antitoxin system/antitoxin (DNA-binding transcriptional repressor) of toxin-antitoxin stability system
MKPKVYTITEAKAQLSDILRRVKRGERIAIGASRNPEVELRLYSPTPKCRKFGKLAGEIWLSEDFTESDSNIQRLFEGS